MAASSAAALWFVFSLAACCPRTRFASATPPTLNGLFPNDSLIDRKAFPDTFKFGALTWAVKHEAATSQDGKSVSVWDDFALQGGTVIDDTTPANGSDHYHRYPEDIELLTDLGMDSYKISIAWTRMFPNGTGEVNEKAMAHYNDVIDRLIDIGIEPFVVLYEQDMPQVLEDTYGGLLSPLFIDDFVHFANACFSAFGDRVKHWVTFEEGNDFIPFTYAGTYSPPGRCSVGLPSYNCSAGNSSTEPYIAAHNMLLAHGATVQLYRNVYQSTQQGKIGLAVWFRWFEPLTNSTVDLDATQRATDFNVGWFVDPILYGDYPTVMRELVGSRLPSFTEVESARLRGSVDFIGLNAVTAIYCSYDDEYKTNTTGYFQDSAVKLTRFKDGKAIGKILHFLTNFSHMMKADVVQLCLLGSSFASIMNYKRLSCTFFWFVGDEYIVPWCMEKIIGYMRTHYNNFPTYITALGCGSETHGDETLNDIDRVEFYSSYLKSLIIEIRNGANVQGLYVWSLIDGFELILGLHWRFGIYYVDDDLIRYPRLSALWFKYMLKGNSTSEAYKS